MYSRKTKEEFDLREEDIPDNMKEEQPRNFLNYVDMNSKLSGMTHELTRAQYFSKLQYNVQN